LWTIEQTAAKEYLLDQKMVNAYLPTADIKVTTLDPYGRVARTRIDQPFSVEINISGLLTGLDLPPSASSVLLERHLASYQAGQPAPEAAKVLAGTPFSSAYLNANGKMVLRFIQSNYCKVNKFMYYALQRTFPFSDRRPTLDRQMSGKDFIEQLSDNEREFLEFASSSPTLLEILGTGKRSSSLETWFDQANSGNALDYARLVGVSAAIVDAVKGKEPDLRKLEKMIGYLGQPLSTINRRNQAKNQLTILKAKPVPTMEELAKRSKPVHKISIITQRRAKQASKRRRVAPDRKATAAGI
jgi:hypothetical protein